MEYDSSDVECDSSESDIECDTENSDAESETNDSDQCETDDNDTECETTDVDLKSETDNSDTECETAGSDVESEMDDSDISDISDFEDYNSKNMKNQCWEHAYNRSPKGPPPEGERGHWLLFFHTDTHPEIWPHIQYMTRMGDLGYMSSLAPGPMTYGRAEGLTAICVHVRVKDKASVKKILKKNGYCSNIQRFDLRRINL